jgi:hypothetical protein
MIVRVAHFLFITYARLLQKFEIFSGKLIMHLHHRRFRLNQHTQDKAEAEGTEQSAEYRKGKSFSTREAHVHSRAPSVISRRAKRFPRSGVCF